MPDDHFPAYSELEPQGHLSPTPQERDAVDTEVQSWSRNLRLLVEVNSAVAGGADEEKVPGHILLRLREATRVNGASVYRLIPEERLLRRVVEDGGVKSENRRDLPLDGPGAVPRAARTAEGVYLPDVADESQLRHLGAAGQAEYAVPLLIGPTVIGVLDVESDHPDGIRAVTRKLIDQVAHQIALSLERSTLSRRLRASEERFRSIFEQGHIGVGISELHGEIVAVNPAFAHFVGYQPDELLGRHYTELIHPDDRETILEGVRQLTQNRAAVATAETRFLHKSGEVIWGASSFSVIRNSAGGPLHVMVMVHDTTRGRKAEAEGARLQERLSHLQKMEAMGALTGGIVHDFNNLLGVIRGYISLTRLRLRRDDPMQEAIGMIEQSAERAAELAHELLQLARRETRKVRMLDLDEEVQRVLKIVSQTFDRRISIVTRLAKDLPRIEGDPGELELAILNLCINARDAMPEGGTLTVETSVVPMKPQDPPASTPIGPREFVRLAIRDSGVGMEPQVLERIFEPFYTTKKAGHGSGLGLAMVYEIVSGHGGFVRAESQPGEGSEFTLFLPVATRREEKPTASLPPTMERGVGIVLVVDDEPFMRAFAQDALEELGYQVLVAEDGNRACEVFRAHSSEIDYVILDMIMPGVSWRETLRALRRINPKIRVVVSTGYAGGTEAQQAVDAGAEGFLGKPYNVETLASTLYSMQSPGQAQRGQNPPSP